MNQSELNHVKKVLKKQLEYFENLIKANFNVNSNLSPTDLRSKERTNTAARQDIGNIKLYQDLTSNYRATLSLLLKLE